MGRKKINDYAILGKTQINLGSEMSLVATPVGSETITASYPTTMHAITLKVTSSTPDRRLIRAYFDCLKKRNNAPNETESIGTKIIKDLIESIQEKRWPEKEGIFVFPFVIVFLFLLLLGQQVGWAIFVIFVFFLVSLIPVDKPPNLPTPPVTDEQIFKWLEMDLENLIEKGKAELRIMTTTGDDLGNLIDGEPITLMSGVSEKLDKSSLLELVRFLDMVKSDYFVEKGLDGKNKYSIYDFLAIYPCKNFIAYYRCKWNFIGGVSLKDETCEYMYDSIVSVKTWEDSVSLNKKNNNADNDSNNQKMAKSVTINALINQKMAKPLTINALTNQEGGKTVNFEVFEINTTDSKSIMFPVLQDSRFVDATETFNFEKMQPSKARNAAYLIRQQVRQRKPGFIKTQSVNEMRQSLLED